jgi:hypothetical protein
MALLRCHLDFVCRAEANHEDLSQDIQCHVQNSNIVVQTGGNMKLMIYCSIQRIVQYEAR